jgi:hypothetical protein
MPWRRRRKVQKDRIEFIFGHVFGEKLVFRSCLPILGPQNLG